MKKTDKADRRKNDKIEPFHITDEMLLDREMDEFLRQSMIEEADRLEEELNSDPELMGIGASDDLFLKIKARLQEMGAWEEEEDKEQEDRERKEKEEAETVEPENTEGVGEKAEKPGNTEGEREKTAEPENTEDVKEKKKQENVYQLLSEEDREALEIGRKVRTRRKKKGRYWKRVAVAVVVLAALLAVGTQGGADRNWILGALDRFITVTGNRLRIDYQDDQENMELNEAEEREAWEKIKKELNIPVIEFFYKPDDMIFNKVYISKKTGEARMFYWYRETVVQIYLEPRGKNSSVSFISEEDAFLQDVIINNQEIEIKIWNTTTKSAESYEASFEYQDALYFISGQLPFEEMEKMMGLIYLY